MLINLKNHSEQSCPSLGTGQTKQTFKIQRWQLNISIFRGWGQQKTGIKTPSTTFWHS